jgi:hypothetical protein
MFIPRLVIIGEMSRRPKFRYTQTHKRDKIALLPVPFIFGVLFSNALNC